MRPHICNVNGVDVFTFSEDGMGFVVCKEGYWIFKKHCREEIEYPINYLERNIDLLAKEVKSGRPRWMYYRFLWLEDKYKFLFELV